MTALAAFEEIIDASGAAARIEAMLPTGVRRRQLTVHTLLAGMCLTQADGRPAQPGRDRLRFCPGTGTAASLGGTIATARVQYPARGASLACPLREVMAGSETRAPLARGFLRPQGGGSLWLAGPARVPGRWRKGRRDPGRGPHPLAGSARSCKRAAEMKTQRRALFAAAVYLAEFVGTVALLAVPLGVVRGFLAALTALAVAAVTYLALFRRRVVRWGTTAGEAGRPMPGDDIVPPPPVPGAPPVPSPSACPPPRCGRGWPSSVTGGPAGTSTTYSRSAASAAPRRSGPNGSSFAPATKSS